ncbi:DUF4111 domain-containing protein [Nocardia panacis]|uniref:DUF4111 domain-containing protein n=1 Tax=Nocardia panacis TaxID=2340916 RepID=A0A3A4K0U6_9NOCA|nr:aminoglycoside adenylyltransferase domain-containing protein [Nocardia panacis]RJO73320.1 DUF4111 domain-containing protein [Nocardia panacis]
MHVFVDMVLDAYLESVDAQAPGLVEGLYLGGSVAFDDFRPRASDIDFLAVTARPLDGAELTALADVHERLQRRFRRPCLDGVYLTWSDLAAGPTAAAERPVCYGGRLEYERPSSVTPMLWHTVARHGIARRGPEPGRIDIWTDSDALVRWCARNLDEFWARGLDAALAHPLGRPGLCLLTDMGIGWLVTGMARHHRIISTGEVISKQDATRQALHAFPGRWRRIIKEALRIHAGSAGRSLYSGRLARRRDALAFGRMILERAHHTGESRTPRTLMTGRRDG